VSLPESEQLLLEQRAGVLHMTLQRPQARNAMTLEMVAALRAAILHAEADEAMRVVVLRGAGGHFCAGADLKELLRARSQPKIAGADPVAEVNAAFGQLCLTFARSSLPTVCVLEGAVLGGGFGLACASDVCLAANSAVFGLPETSLGIVPAQIAPFLVERLGFAQAKRVALCGGKLDAAQALALGLVHELHPNADALERALEATLARLLACAPRATRATKQLLLRARSEPPEALIEHAAAVFAAAATSPEGVEGSLAFLQKRRPAWDPAKD
jgi:isohexenylglutaconyl-CoA hydratase